MIVVTGAAGFIGSCLLKDLEGEVVCCDPADKKMLSPAQCVRYIN